MTLGKPKVFSIAAERGFLDSLAAGLLQRAKGDPQKLAEPLILLPNRRAGRALTEAFLKMGEGRALLLPRILPLGDLDPAELLLGGALAKGDLPAPTPPLKRLLTLTKLVEAWQLRRGEADLASAAGLAEELAAFLDQMETEELDPAKLAELAPSDFAEHWKETLEFLSIVLEVWPKIEAEAGGIGPAAYRRRLLDAQALQWQKNPPAFPVIAAGSTGSIPASARLLSVIARLPKGEVILPGLDLESDEATWKLIGQDPTHPQHLLARLLATLEVPRRTVGEWQRESAEPEGPRRFFIRQLFLPAAASERWRGLRAPEKLDEGLSGLERYDCQTTEEEAVTAALLLRQALEVPGQTAALVTPDRALARRVAGEMKRWGIAIDDSAGRPLATTPPAVFMRLLVEAAQDRAAPVPLLALLKHPLASGGEATAAFRAKVRSLEVTSLRGPRPDPGFAGLIDEIKHDELKRWVKAWSQPLQDFFQLFEKDGELSLADMIAAHLAAAEALAASDKDSGAARLWRGEDGETLAEFFTDFASAAELLQLSALSYGGLLTQFLEGLAVRPAWGRHPRLFIWGPVEARLQRADLLVLGGLDEGTWPGLPETGPFLSRPMRRQMGLPPLEQRIGQAAHDLEQALAAPRVILTRSLRRDGAPSVPSRWLLRAEAVLQALGAKDAVKAKTLSPLWIDALDRPKEHIQAQEPRPAPPFAARPKQLSISDVTTWMSDPYALYAKKILGLYELAPLDQRPEAPERGSYLHRVFEVFAKHYPKALPKDGEAALGKIASQVGAEMRLPQRDLKLWQPQLESLFQQFIEFEMQRRQAIDAIFTEVKGKAELGPASYRITLVGKADRIERRKDKTLAILDYKTGKPPSKNQVAHGDAPQLPLEAIIAECGGFPEVGAAKTSELVYVRLSQTGTVEAKTLDLDPMEAAQAAAKGLTQLLDTFADASVPYLARPRGGGYDTYDHLSRIAEWSLEGEE